MSPYAALALMAGLLAAVAAAVDEATGTWTPGPGSWSSSPR
jgi:hypothetical protein